MTHALACGALVLAVVIAWIGAIGIVCARDPFQRLHFIALPAGVSSLLVALAVLLDDPAKQAGVKAIVLALVLLFANGALSQITAQAAWLRSKGGWPPAVEPPEQRPSPEAES